MARIVITTEALRELPGPHLDLLHAAGHEVAYPVKVVLLTEADTLDAVRGFDAVIAGSEPYTDRVLGELLPQLRVVSRNGVGHDQIDVPAATRRGIAVAITPAGNYGAVAEHAFALMLAVCRRMVTGSNDTKAGHWRRRHAFIPLRSSTLGIVGLGRIGCAVATRAKAFGMRVLACDQFPNELFARVCGIEMVSLEELLTQADIVTLHIPITPDTRDLINSRTLARMKRGSVLINTARGGLIDEEALREALVSGQLAGAGLDVLKAEPPPADHPLLALDNVIVTPHLAAFDTRAREDMATAAAQNIIDLLAGNWPEGSIVNPDVRALFER